MTQQIVSKSSFIKSLLKSFFYFRNLSKDRSCVDRLTHLSTTRAHCCAYLTNAEGSDKVKIMWTKTSFSGISAHCWWYPALLQSKSTMSHISAGRAFYPVLTSPITANAPGNEAIFKPKLVVRWSLYENYCFDVMWRCEGSGEVSFKQSKSKEEEGVFLNTSLVFIRWSIAWNSTNSINAMDQHWWHWCH